MGRFSSPSSLTNSSELMTLVSVRSSLVVLIMPIVVCPLPRLCVTAFRGGPCKVFTIWRSSLAVFSAAAILRSVCCAASSALVRAALDLFAQYQEKTVNPSENAAMTMLMRVVQSMNLTLLVDQKGCQLWSR